jgi:hypothetical protein
MAIRVLPRGILLWDAVGRLHISRLCYAVHRHGRGLKDWRAAEDELQVVGGLRTANDRKAFYDRSALREIEHAHTNWQRRVHLRDRGRMGHVERKRYRRNL